MLAGVKYAHEHGIVHRDLKPQNVLVDSEGRARVTDFGIARAGASEITQTGSVLGTAQYLSPEQAQGLPVTAASDIYSVGVILYEALTGRVPFDADSPVTVALKQVSERPRPPSELNPAVSRALDGVVLRALAKDPVNRFASAEEFLQALDVAEQDPTGAAFGDTASYAAVAAAAGTAPPAPPEEPQEDRGFFTPWRIALLALILLLLAGADRVPPRCGGGGTSDVLVPTVLNKSKGEATKILTDAGFQVAPDPVPRANAIQGKVDRAGPARPDRERREGSTVTITYTIGLGKAPDPGCLGEEPLPRPRRQLKDAAASRRIPSQQHSNHVKTGSLSERPRRPGPVRARAVGDDPGLERPEPRQGALGRRSRPGRRRHADPRRRAEASLPEAGVRPSPRGRSSTRARAGERRPEAHDRDRGRLERRRHR